jgi:hypothetical protein
MRATGFIGTVVLVLVMGFGVGPELPGSTETASTDVRPAEGPIDTNRATASGAEAVPGHTSVAAERGRQGTSQWRLRKPAIKGQIEGYAHRVSVPSGERVKLKISTGAARFRVVAFRFGAYRGGLARRVWRSRMIDGERQRDPVFSPRRTRTVVAPWHSSLSVSTRGWAPGVYVFKLVASTGWQAHVPLVVRSRSTKGKVALMAPVATWQAYNDWGGYSLYHGPTGDRRSWAVSQNRPYPAPGAKQMLFGAMPVVVHAEQLGIPLAYLTNMDLAADGQALRGARGLVSMGHDEYWSLDMRQRVLSARRHGTNLAFLGANTMYWRIRTPTVGQGPRRDVVGYRSDAQLDPLYDEGSARTTARFRDPPKPKPENSLIGMRYECFPVEAPYRVVSPGWWGFRGTGASRGDQFPGLVGIEADRVYPVPRTPRPLQILSHVTYDCGGVGTSAQSIYYTTRSGAGVFTAGTLRWTCALRDRCGTVTPPATRLTRRVTTNLLKAFARGPVGRRHPAHDNVARFHLPKQNQVPAS